MNKVDESIMRIFIANGNPTERLALQMYLQREPGINFIGMASEALGLLAQIEAARPDVVLLDSQLPGASTQNLLAEIRRLKSPPRVVVLSVRPEEKQKVLAAGATAFVAKATPPEDLLLTLRSLMGQA